MPHYDTDQCSTTQVTGRIFSTLDLKSGYWQLPDSRRGPGKNCLHLPSGAVVGLYKRVSFGLANAPAHFQRTMSRVLAPLLGVCALVYIDDLVIVYSRDLAEHVQHLRQCFLFAPNAHGIAAQER